MRADKGDVERQYSTIKGTKLFEKFIAKEKDNKLQANYMKHFKSPKLQRQLPPQGKLATHRSPKALRINHMIAPAVANVGRMSPQPVARDFVEDEKVVLGRAKKVFAEIAA